MNDCSCKCPSEAAVEPPEKPVRSLGVVTVFDGVVLNAGASLQSLPFLLHPQTNTLQLTFLVISSSGSVAINGFVLGGDTPTGPWTTIGTFNLGAIGFSAAAAVSGISFRYFAVFAAEATGAIVNWGCYGEMSEG